MRGYQTVGMDPDTRRRLFAKRLHAELDKRGWSQAELARRAGLNRSVMSGWFTARSFPEPRFLKLLAEGFGMSPEELVGAPATAPEPAASLFPWKLDPVPGHPNLAHLKIDQILPATLGAKIIHLVSENANTNMTATTVPKLPEGGKPLLPHRKNKDESDDHGTADAN